MAKQIIPNSLIKTRKTNANNVLGIIPNNGTDLNKLVADTFKSDTSRTNYRLYENSITAFATGGQANATQLNNKEYQIATTVATNNDSVKLTKAQDKLVITVINKGAATLTVFPTTGDDVDSVTNGDTDILAGASATFLGLSTTEWITL